jgi:murein DD-endopeptidase MepM/ murein hydrolase activator NlpD
MTLKTQNLTNSALKFIVSIALLTSCSTLHSAQLNSQSLPSTEPNEGSLLRGSVIEHLLATDEVQDGDNNSEEEDIAQNDQENTDIKKQDSFVETGDFDWPVDEARLTRGFKIPGKTAPLKQVKKSKKYAKNSRRQKRSRRPHLGIDLAAAKGTAILASQTGTVIYTGKDFRGYGRMVMIESAQGFATLYAHLDKIHVLEGQKVSRGEVIASMGRTGRATGVHLHFEIRDDHGPVDPLHFLPNGTVYSQALMESDRLKREITRFN